MRKLAVIAMAMAFAFGYAGAASAGDAAKGQTWWDSKCKKCHNMDAKKKVGPGLEGITKKRSDAWMTKWLVDPDKTWEENDAETQAMKKDAGKEAAKKTSMKIGAKLTEADAADIIAYMKANGG